MPNLRESVCAVIVSYNCSPSLRENVAKLRPQVDILLIVDNGSTTECISVLEELHANYGCHIIYNKRNLGIAGALNIGVDFANQHALDWIVTFDQDSRVSENFIASMLQTYNDCPDQSTVAMLLPSLIDPSSQLDLARIRCTFTARNGAILTGITSGAMTKTGVFQSCGSFREDFFIDCVDTEFCLRINRSGWKIVQSKQAILFHKLGQLTSRTFLGRPVRTTNHSAARRYYRTRNRVLLWWLYLPVYPSWVADDMLAFVRETLNLVYIEGQKGEKLRSILIGIRDAVVGRLGYQAKL